MEKNSGSILEAMYEQEILEDKNLQDVEIEMLNAKTLDKSSPNSTR